MRKRGEESTGLSFEQTGIFDVKNNGQDVSLAKESVLPDVEEEDLKKTNPLLSLTEKNGILEQEILQQEQGKDKKAQAVETHQLELIEEGMDLLIAKAELAQFQVEEQIASVYMMLEILKELRPTSSDNSLIPPLPQEEELGHTISTKGEEKDPKALIGKITKDCQKLNEGTEKAYQMAQELRHLLFLYGAH